MWAFPGGTRKQLDAGFWKPIGDIVYCILEGSKKGKYQKIKWRKLWPG